MMEIKNFNEKKTNNFYALYRRWWRRKEFIYCCKLS